MGAVVWLRALARRSGLNPTAAAGPLPGDDLLRDPPVQWTRATVLDAEAAEIWPWLVQMGFGRGGWYTSERFDRLVWRIANPSAETILEEWQQLAVGEIVPDGPEFAAYFHVASVDRDRHIVYRSIRHPWRGHPVDPSDRPAVAALEQRLRAEGMYLDFSWAWVLTPVAGGRTRVTVRTRAAFEPRWLGYLEIPLGLVDLYHVSTMFSGLRRRVDASQ